MSTSPELNSSYRSLAFSNFFLIKIAAAALCVLFVIVLTTYFRVKNQPDSVSSSSSALDAAALNSVPAIVFISSNSDCAICLGDLAGGDLGRVLPGCSHGFHLDCIDEWFRVDSTCPICRSSVDPPQKLPASYSGTKSATFVNEAANDGVKEGTLQRAGSSASAAAPAEISAFERRAEEKRWPGTASLTGMMSSAFRSLKWDLEEGGGAGGRS